MSVHVSLVIAGVVPLGDTVHSEISSQILFDFKRMVSHSISPKFSGKIPYVLSMFFGVHR